jgi:cell volume regulation protein A
MQAPVIPQGHAVPDETQILGLLGGLLILAFFANRFSRLSRVPDLFILMLTGLVLGPLSGWLEAGELMVFTKYLGTFALILILFEAGAEIRLREALRHFPVGLLFAVVSFAASFVAAACVGRWMIGLAPYNSLRFGAVLGCVSGTVMIPVLQQFEIGGAVAVVLVLEAAMGDVIAVMTVGSLTNIAEGDPLFGGFLTGLVTRTLVATAGAVAAGLVWSRGRSRFAADRFSNVLQVAVVLLVFTLTRLAGGSGLLAVLAFGLTVANTKGGAPDTDANAPGLLTFHSDLSFLTRSFFFVLLGASVQLVGRAYLVAAVVLLAGLVLGRIGSVYALGLAMRNIRKPERNLLITLLPRGLVNAVLAIEVAAQAPEMEFLPAMAFTLILATNLLVVLATWRFRQALD